MKKILVVLSFLPWIAFAEKVSVDQVSTDENTTIEIKKGDKATTADHKYEITEGSDEIAGDSSPLLQDARKNWKKACEDWKKEFKELNKDNQVLSLNCGSMNCKTVSMESTCSSTTKYKLRVQVK